MDIRIAKTSKHCYKTEKPFEHGESVISAVRLIDQEYRREDYAESEWADADADAAIAVWSTKYWDPAVAEQEPDETYSPLRQLFYEGAESEDRIERAKTFLAAELLRRQKVFRLLKQGDDPDEGGRVTLYRDRIGDKMVEVRDPQLTYDDLEAGRTALVARLQEIESPPEEETSGDAEDSSDSDDDFDEEIFDDEDEFDDDDDDFEDDDDDEA